MNKKVLFVTILIMSLSVMRLTYAGSPLGSNPMGGAKDAMDGSQTYEVNKTYVWQWTTCFYTFEPTEVKATKGIIIYPGANIDVRSYAVLAGKLASNGYLVALVPMPLDFAIWGYNRAEKVIKEIRSIDKWAICGHSLGGTMACCYAKYHPSKIDGVILLASYPSSFFRLDRASLVVVSVFGTNDGLTTLDEIFDSEAHLPADTSFVKIEGANHSQFGYYSPETFNDGDAAISRELQTGLIADAVIDFMTDF